MPKISKVAEKNVWCNKMRFINRKFRRCPALTILEIIIALAIIGIIFAAVLLQFRAIHNGWDSRQAGTEVLQNGRVLIGHINRNLAKAVKINAVSDYSETDGFIEFLGNDGNDRRYDINSVSNYVEFGLIGNLSDLAGPVNSLTFTCYDACDLDTPLDIATADVNDIRFVNVQTTLPNPAALGKDKTFVASTYLRTNDEIAQYDPNLIACWKLNESSGLTAADSSGNNNDGTLRNMVGDEWIDGIIDGALNFDGSNDYIAIQNLYYEGSGYPEVTVSAWIRTSNGGNQIIVSFDRNEYWRLEVNGNGGGTGQIGWDVYTSTGQVDYGSNTRVDDGLWHHVAGVFDNGTLTIYIDGNPETPTSGGSTFGRGVNDRYGFLGVGSEATTFDGSKGPNNYFDGDMDDVRIYDRALDSNEIAQLAETLEFVDFTEAKVGSDDTSITISTPDTNEGDLLIAAVATDGDTSTTLSPPAGEGWVGVVNDYSSQVTLGAWYKLADASESASHQFMWSGGQKAYGWIMHFTGHDLTNPINAYSTFGQSSSTPTSPAVTTTVNNCLILRLGAFDNDDITEDDTGLTNHTTITMDDSGASGSTLFQDDFEIDFSKWTDGGSTDWDRTTAQYVSPSYSAHAGRWENDLISDNIDLSSYSYFTIDFWYRDHGIDNSDNVYLQFYDGSNYDNRFELGNTWPEDTWHNYNETINNSGADAQYFRNNFRIKFEGSSIDNNEDLWIDDVTITVPGSGTVSGGAGYIKQSSAGSSGTANFTLTSANGAQMLTVAIAPAEYSCGCGEGQIRP
jgi:type II secretory pathway pseudopilin PulG